MAGKNKLKKGPMLLGGLNLDDVDSLLDDGGSSSSGKRTPKESIRQFSGAATRSIKERVNTRTVLSTFMRTALPDGYIRLLGLYDEGKRGIDTVIDGIEETEFANLEALAEKFEDQLPKLKGKLPDATYQRLKEKIEEKKGDYALRRQIDNARAKAKSGDYDTDGETTSVDQMFKDLEESRLDFDKANSDVEHNKLDYEVKRDGIRARLDKSRFDVLNRHLGMIADASQRGSAFNDTVTYQFQRKSLELQMRQYMATRTLVKLTNETLNLHRKAYTDLVHNTGLPDFMKSSNAERTKFDLSERARNPFTNMIAKTSTDFAANFLPMLFNNIGSKGAGAIRGGSQMGNAGLMAMLKRLAQNPEENLGGMAGNEVANFIHRTIIPTVSRRVRPGLKRVSDKLTAGTDSKISYTLDNLASITQAYANDASQSAGWRGQLQGLVKMFAPQFRLNDVVKTGTYQTIDQPAPFNQHALRSVTEIIPGYLSRILHETRMIRTGDDTIGRESYDITRSSFVSDSVAKDNLSKRVVGMGARRNLAWTMSGAVGTFDSKGVLSPEAKHALEERLLRDAMEGRHFDPEQYVRMDGYAPGTDAAVLAELETFFKRKFRFDQGGKLKNQASNYNRRQEFSVKFNELRDSVKSPIAEIERLLQSGNSTALRELGIIHTVEGEDRINFAVLRDYYRDLGSDGAGPAPVPPAPTDPKLKNLRKKLREQNDKMRSKLGRFGERIRGGFNSAKGSAQGGLDDIMTRIRNASGNLSAGGFGLPSNFNGVKFTPVSGLGINSHIPSNAIIQEALNKGKQDIARRAEELQDKAHDLIVVGKNQVTIRAGEILDGSLIDVNTQKVITQIKDIKGEVIDRAGNVRLTQAEVAAGLVTTAGKHLNILNLPTRIPPNVMSMLAGQRQNIGNLITQENGAMSRVKDLYLEGANDPVIKAAGIRAGEYIDLSTKKVIETIDDISGAVAKVSNPTEVLFTAQEAATNLVDREGKRFRSSKILRYLAWATKGSLNITGGLLKIGLATVRKTAMFLRKRLSTLDAYLPDSNTPVLTATKLKAGQYYHENGKVISSFDDLRDGVYSADGNLLVSPDDIPNLINRDGTKHTAAKRRSWLRKMAKKALIGAPTAALKGIGRAWWKGTKAYYRGMGNMIAKRFTKSVAKADNYNENYITPTDGILGQILSVLDRRLPQEAPRAGSWEAKLAEAKAAEKAKREGKLKPGVDRKKKSGGLLDGLKSLLGFGRKSEDEESDGGDTYIDLGDDSSEGRDRQRGRRRGNRPRGRMGRAWDKLKGSRVGQAVGRGAGAIGSRLGGLGARIGGSALLSSLAGSLGVNLPSIGAIASTAMGGLSLGGIASGIGTGLATAGTAILGILGSPVFLGAAAVAAVGAGGYWLWNRSSKVSGDFRELRLMQYGIDSTGDKLKVLEFEAYVEQFATKGAEPRLNINSADPKKLLEIMDIDDDEPEEIVRFANWIEKRFKPVFFTWLKAMHQLTPTGVLINELDEKLPDAAKYDFLQIVKTVPKEVYGELVNPLDEDPIEVDPADINEKITDLIDDWRDSAKAKDENKTGDTTGAVSAKPSGVADAGKAATANTGPSVLDRIKSGAKSLLMATPIGAAAAGLYKAVKDNWFGKLFSGAGSAVTSALSGASALGGLVLKSSVAFASAFKANQLTTMQAVRVRAYGKMQLDQNTISQLFEAEAKLYEQTSFSSDGQAAFKGNLDVLLGQVASIFGVDISDSTSRKAQEFTAWMLQRFIPVGLAYFAAVKQKANAITPSRVESALSDADKLAVANAIMTATYEYNGDNIAIWKAETFFNNGTSGPDALKAAAEVEVAKLKELVDKARLASPGTSVKEQENQANSTSRTTADKILEKASALGSALREKFSSFASGVKESVGGAVNTVKDWLGFGGDKAQTPATSAYSPAYSPGGSLEQRGSVFQGFAEGNGGIWNSIPLPKANKSRAAAMPTLLAVQAMTGVDAELLATFCSIESNFDYLIKAPTSSATGWFQFINGTWDGMLAQAGSKYGIPPDNKERYLRKDPRINALMGAEFLKGNYKVLAKAIKRSPTDTDLYAAHFFGAGTAASFLTKDQNAIAASFFPKQANANRGIFYKKTGQPRTIGEVYALFESKVREHRKGGAGQDVGTSPIGEPDAQKLADMQAQAAAASADIKTNDDAVNGEVGTNGNSGTNDSISMVADRAAAPMRMGDPSTMPTTTPAQSTGGSTVVTSGQELPERQRALEEAANRAAASDKARTAEVKEKQAISEASINYMERQLTTQEQMRDLLRVIAEKVGHPTVVPQSTAPAPSAPANDMGSTQPQRAERSAGSAPAAVTFKR